VFDADLRAVAKTTDVVMVVVNDQPAPRNIRPVRAPAWWRHIGSSHDQCSRYRYLTAL